MYTAQIFVPPTKRCGMEKKMKKFNIGLTVQFGDYNWCILNIKNNMALIITENIIEQRAYHDAYGDI